MITTLPHPINIVAKLLSFATKRNVADSLTKISCKDQMLKSVLLQYHLGVYTLYCRLWRMVALYFNNASIPFSTPSATIVAPVTILLRILENIL